MNRSELLFQCSNRPAITLCIAVLSGASLVQPPSAFSADKPAEAALQQMVQNQKGIHVMLSAWAQDNDGAFPDDPLDANANFRQLFMARLMDSEKPFVLRGDGLVEIGQPDGIIGSAPDYTKALEPGELSIAYVAGLGGASPSHLSMLVSGAGPALGWIMGVDKAQPKEPFRKAVIVTTLGGTTNTYTPDADGKIRDMKNDQRMDIFSPAYGTNPDKIRLPATSPARKP